MKGVRAVVIGASAGGVTALFTVLGALPAGYGIPVVCVLHLPDDRHSQLAEVLQRRLQRPVCEARDKQPLKPGQVYVAGPGYHLSVERDFTLSLSQEPPRHFPGHRSISCSRRRQTPTVMACSACCLPVPMKMAPKGWPTSRTAGAGPSSRTPVTHRLR
jgi:hypothetical protein